MNTNLLKSIMVLNGDNIKTLALKLNLSRQTLSLKIDGINDFKLSEVKKICKLYELTEKEMLQIFFGGVSNECA